MVKRLFKKERDAVADISLAHPEIPIKFVDYEVTDAGGEENKSDDNS